MSCSFLQSNLWTLLKGSFDWEPYTFHYEGKTINVLLRRFCKIFSLAYVPYAPIEQPDFEEFSKKLKEELPKGCVLIRFDLPWYVEQEGQWTDAPKSFRKASMDIQPPSSVILNISRPLDEILKGMKDRARRNIKKAEKSGVIVSCHGADKLPVWYELYKETSERDRIASRPIKYYQKLFELAANQKRFDVRLYLASIDDDVLAGIITMFDGREATYLYGASSNRKRETQPNYAVQWRAIQDAKAAGCMEYDFFGIPPTDDPNHPMHGLYLFKTGWGGTIVHRPGCWDYPCRPVLYRLSRVYESIRKWYYKVFKKKKRSGLQ